MRNFDWGDRLAHVMGQIIEAFIILLAVAVIAAVLFLLVRYLLIATRAAQIYVNQHEPRVNGGPGDNSEPTPPSGGSPSAPTVAEDTSTTVPADAAPTVPADAAPTVPADAAPTTAATKPTRPVTKPVTKPRTPKTPPS